MTTIVVVAGSGGDQRADGWMTGAFRILACSFLMNAPIS
jgi:hypothetical protein